MDYNSKLVYAKALVINYRNMVINYSLKNMITLTNLHISNRLNMLVINYNTCFMHFELNL